LPNLYTLSGTDLLINPLPSDLSLVGTKTVTIKASCATTPTVKNFYSFTINVWNNPPIFDTSPPLTFADMYLNETQRVTLPTVSDPEGHSIIISVIPSTWIRIEGSEIVFNPTMYSQMGIGISVTMIVSDTKNST